MYVYDSVEVVSAPCMVRDAALSLSSPIDLPIVLQLIPQQVKNTLSFIFLTHTH